MVKKKLSDYYDPTYSERIRVNKIPAHPEPEVVEIIKSLVGRTCLDIGCGLGRNCLYLARNGFDVKAIDLSEIAIGYIQGIAKNENLKILATRVNALTDELEEYDLVLASYVLDEFDQPKGRWLIKRMQEATLGGGINIILTCTRGTPKGNQRSRSGHYFFTQRELLTLYNEAGWSILTCDTDTRRISGVYAPVARLIAKKI